MKVLKSKIAMLLVMAMVLSNGGTLVLAESIDDVVSETQNTELNSQSKASVYYEELEITEANDDVVGADIIRPTVEANDDETTVGADIIRPSVEADIICPTIGSNDDTTTNAVTPVVSYDRYYFGADGIMYKNQITPDGYIVNGNGEWVQ